MTHPLAWILSISPSLIAERFQRDGYSSTGHMPPWQVCMNNILDYKLFLSFYPVLRDFSTWTSNSTAWHSMMMQTSWNSVEKKRCIPSPHPTNQLHYHPIRTAVTVCTCQTARGTRALREGRCVSRCSEECRSGVRTSSDSPTYYCLKCYCQWTVCMPTPTTTTTTSSVTWYS